jgi:hypothetical protein
MATITDEELIERCKALIEEKIGWGNSENWSNRDFEELSQKIFDATDVNLSPTTLKRIWGKVRYDSAPTLTTLDTLARFAGFEHWRTFRQAQHVKDTEKISDVPIPVQEPAPDNISAPPKRTAKKSSLFAMLLFGICVLVVVLAYFFFSRTKAQANLPLANYKFISRKVLKLGVPNSVVFDYDASGAPVDSVFIQQSWDILLSTQVPKNQHQHTSIYYYPGFFQAKLRVGKQVVKEDNVFIQTDGWLSMVEQKPTPVYFKKEEAIDGGKMSLSVDKIKSKNIPLQPDPPIVNFSNIHEFGDLKTDNFIFETSFKNDYEEGSNICQKTEIRIVCEGSMISIPLSAKGCISENNLFCLGRFLRGTENDLSGFGVDFRDFVKFRLEMRNGNAQFFVNDKIVYHIDGLKMSSKIVGIVYRFHGSGSVDFAKLKKIDGATVYDDEF